MMKQEDEYWKKLCLHALVRGMVFGNLSSQHMFATKHALFFRNSTEPEVVLSYVLASNHQLAVFSFVGCATRTLLIALPNWNGFLTYIGLGCWILGLVAISALGESISFQAYQMLSLFLVSVGGGMYIWSSMDDVILLTSHQSQYHAMIVMLGCFSTVYMVGTHWLYTEFSTAAKMGYLFVHPVLLMLGLPLVVGLCVEERIRGRYSEYASRIRSVSMWNELCFVLSSESLLLTEEEKTIRIASRSFSFDAHILFIVFFGIFKHLASMILVISNKYTVEENELFFLWKSAGLVLGESLFSLCYQWMYIPTISSTILPIVMLDWLAHPMDSSRVLTNIFLLGLCVGTLNVWIVHRVITQWILRPSKGRLTVLLWIMSIASLPGDISVNWIVELSKNATGNPHASVLSLSVVLSFLVVFAVTMHWIMFHMYEGISKQANLHTFTDKIVVRLVNAVAE